MSELAAKMPHDLPGERGQGFSASKEQYLNEMIKENLPSWLKPDRLDDQYKETEPQKDKDIEAPDRD